MRGYARLDSDRPFIRRQSILVLSAVDSMLSESSVPSPLRRQMAVADVQRASGRVHEIQYTCRWRIHPCPIASHVYYVSVYTLFYIYTYTFLRTPHDAVHSRGIATWSDNFLSRCDSNTPTRRLRNLFVMLDEAICCYRAALGAALSDKVNREIFACVTMRSASRTNSCRICDQRRDHC